MFKKYHAIIWFLALLFMIGCSNKKEVVQDKKFETNQSLETDSNEQTNEHANENKDPLITDVDFEKIQQIDISITEEGLRSQTGGIFINDIPYEKETAQVWGNFGLGDYEEELTEKLANVTTKTSDPDTLFKALHYYIGSYAYGRAINDVEEFEVEWYEPYLPEPHEMEGNLEEKAPGKAIILLDASTSMLKNIQGKQKMAVAKIAAGRFANTIGNTHDVSLIVYGHAGSETNAGKAESCSTIEEIYPMQKFDAKKFAETVNAVEAKGWTPIAGAIKTAREKMVGTTENVTLYIISDGAETCDGDPVVEAQAFASEKEGRQVNIIGFDVDTTGENSLKEIANAGNGEYISAKTIDDLNNSIKNTWVPTSSEIMSKSNSLLKHWGQMYDSMVDLNTLSSKIYYTGLNERSRFFSAIHIMRTENMITPEVSDTLREKAKIKAEFTLETDKQLAKKKDDQIDAERQDIIERVRDWTDRMFELRKQQ